MTTHTQQPSNDNILSSVWDAVVEVTTPMELSSSILERHTTLTREQIMEEARAVCESTASRKDGGCSQGSSVRYSRLVRFTDVI